jgi:hypothetical protein
MMASLQQAIQKGMPPDQAIQYVKSMATQGVAPLTDLYAMMNQFQRLKQQPVQAPQTPPTIRDQLNMAEQQQAQQQMAMQQQAQQQMAMQQGLGGMPAPAMEQAQFAGGGIVAFSGEDGSLVNEPDDMFYKIGSALQSAGSAVAPSFRRSGVSVVREAQALASQGRTKEALQLLAQNNIDPRQAFGDRIPAATPTQTQTAVPAPAAAPSSGENTPFTREAFMPGTGNPIEKVMRDRELDARRTTPPRTDTTSRVGTDSRVPAAPRVAAEAPVEKKMTLEDFQAPLREAGRPLREATDAYRQFLDKDEASAKEQSGRDRMLALAQAGFGMAEAASKPGATFLGSAAAAGGNFAKNMMQVNREADAAKRGIVKERLALAQAEASGNKSDYIAAYQNLTEHQKTLTEASQFKENMDLKRAGLAVESSLGFARVNAEHMNQAMLAGLRGDEAAARVAERNQQLRVDVAKLAYAQINALRTTSAYIKASPEERLSMEQAEFSKAAAVFGTNMGIGASGGGGTSSMINQADKLVGFNGPG